MSTIQHGDTVQVHYTGTLADGSEFDSSRDREPLEFTVGGNEVLPDFELAVVGLNVGDTKTITIEAAKAYGEYRDDMKLEVALDQVPDELELAIGNQYRIPKKDGGSVVVTVVEIGDESVSLDANHPLAGKDLTFVFDVVGVSEGSEE
jgi:peptidylprolyl isomerase